ncbi:hypothetical protein K2173_008126 [Erythroxylum novogranatense]|uniref:BHLH domain-containing protein n=1 Tax=Erythroxylum novogranatense TaxID=1862640 RepID=A0AAV8S9F0_9ROSI|nr:hypothetical protein K2173_008126 [Erythroxylum novogranatense]
MELVYEHGQILVRGRSTSGPCVSYSSHAHKAQRNKENTDNHPPKRPRALHVDSVVGDEFSPAHEEPTKYASQKDQFIDIYRRWPHTNFDIFLENTRISPIDDHNTQPRLVPVHKTSMPQPGDTPDLVAEVPEVSAAWSHQQHQTLLEQPQNSPILSQTQMKTSGNLSNSKLHQCDSSRPDKHYGLQNFSSLRPTVLLNSDDKRSEAAIRSTGSPNLSRVELETSKNEMDIVKSMFNPLVELPPDEQSEAVVPQNVVTRKQCLDAVFVPESNKEVEKVQVKPDSAKSRDHLAATTSMCSRGASNDSTYFLKRTFEDNEGTAYPSEEDKEGTERKTEANGSSTKRKRTEIQTPSERRRRNKINKKIRALKDLIPSSSKVDKASVLDEAIEYMKTLQLQVQMLSTGNRLFMPPVMFPSGVQHLQAQISAQMSEISMRMHMGLGCSLTPFSALPMHLGLSGQRLPIPVPRPPFIPLIGGVSTHSFPLPGISGVASGPSLNSNGSLPIGSSGITNNNYALDPMIQALHQVFASLVLQTSMSSLYYWNEDKLLPTRT